MSFCNINAVILVFYLVGSLNNIKTRLCWSLSKLYLQLWKISMFNPRNKVNYFSVQTFLHFLLHFMYFMRVSVKQARYYEDCQTSAHWMGLDCSAVELQCRLERYPNMNIDMNLSAVGTFICQTEPVLPYSTDPVVIGVTAENPQHQSHCSTATLMLNIKY